MKKSFKKAQHKINKAVRKFNKYMELDEAFRGRIYARQYSAGWHKFNDGSGVWYGVIRIYDKVTNTYASVLGNEFGIIHGTNGLWIEANKFIVEDLQIKTHREIALGIDYRSMTHDPSSAEPFYSYYARNYSYKQYG